MDNTPRLRLPLNLQFFAGDVGGVADTGADGAGQAQQSTITDSAGLTALLETMNQSQQSGENTNTTQQGATQNQTSDGTQGQPGDDSQQGAQQQQANQNTQQNTQQQKDANAFAQMRVQNKQYSDMLEKIAKAAGIEYTSPEDMMQKLNDDALTKLAAQQNVPVELLKRMEVMEAQANAYVQMQNQNRLTTEFSNLRTKYNLDDASMLAFAQQLEADKVDPATVNVEREYIARNLDAIIAARTQAAVEEALRRDSQAGTHGTMPNVAQGSSANGGANQHKVTTTAELNALLASMPK